MILFAVANWLLMFGMKNIKAKLIAVTEVEGKEKLEEVFPIGG